MNKYDKQTALAFALITLLIIILGLVLILI